MQKGIVTATLIVISVVTFIKYDFLGLIFFLLVLLVLETGTRVLVTTLRKDFQWLITKDDEYPELSEQGLRKFIEHGYDRELGWVRKPNTQKKEMGKEGLTLYHIDETGSRRNPGHEQLAQKISLYGDSFIFGRQVNDNESIQWYLSELTKSNVLNFGVGNYGLDQALLRLKREYAKNKTPIVIMGVVPSTLVRILAVWKHYNEFGNTFGFKPRFILEQGMLHLVPNIIDDESKFPRYREYLPEIQKYDFFYRTKFKKEMIVAPYFVSVMANPSRNMRLLWLVAVDKWLRKAKQMQETYAPPMKVIMDVNLKLRVKLFTNSDAVHLLVKIIEGFKEYASQQGFRPVFLWMPQKDDILLVRSKKSFYYQNLIDLISKKMVVIDLTNDLLKHSDLDSLYSDDNQYGGHFGKQGSKVVAEIVHRKLLDADIVKP